MSILPSMDVSLDTINSVEQSSTGTTLTEFKEYAWDFEKNDFILVDGKFVILKGKEALRVWIWKVLHTLRQRYEIYSDKYGNNLETLIGKGYGISMIRSEAKRLIEECLLQNPHITKIENFKVTNLESSNFNIECLVITDAGEVDIGV